MIDTDRLDGICAQLRRADAAWLREQLLEPWQVRARRLGERDARIRAAAAMLRGTGRAQAEALAAAMRRPASVRRAPPGFLSLLARAVELNGGRTIGWRQIANIIANTRAGERVQKTTIETAQDEG